MMSLLTFSLLYCMKQIDFMLLCVCSVIDHRRCQNVVRTSGTHLPNIYLCATFFVFTTFWSLLWSVTEQTHSNMESICLLFKWIIFWKQIANILFIFFCPFLWMCIDLFLWSQSALDIFSDMYFLVNMF